MKNVSCLLASISFLTIGSLAHAASVVQTDTFTNASLASSTSIPLTFSSFNSSLGTLTAVDYTFTGTLNINGFANRAGTYDITLNVPYRLEAGMQQLDAQTISYVLTGTATNGQSLSGNYSFSTAADNLADNPPTSLLLPSGLTTAKVGSPGLSINSDSISGTFQLTYDYTAAPEPSTWALLLGGVSLLGIVYRLKFCGSLNEALGSSRAHK